MPSNRELEAMRRELREQGVAESDELLNAINVVLDRRYISTWAGRTPKSSQPKAQPECRTNSVLERHEPFERLRKTPLKPRRTKEQIVADLFKKRTKSHKHFMRWLRATEKE